MPVIMQQIESRLKDLQSLLLQIGSLRDQAGELQAELAAVEEEYQREVGPANDERRRLNEDKMGFTAWLTDQHPPLPPPPTGIRPPRVVIEFKQREPVVPPPPREDPRYAHKRALCDFLYDLLEPGQEQVLMSIHAMQTDDRLDLCDMLEALPWGPIWEARQRSETLEDQYLRLGVWQTAFTERLDYWRRAIARLQDEGEGGLLREKKGRSSEAWLAYLRAQAAEQQQENERLRHEVAVLSQQWQAKQAQAGDNG